LAKIDFFRFNLSLDKVYNAKNIFWIAIVDRKIARKNPNNCGILFEAVNCIYILKMLHAAYWHHFAPQLQPKVFHFMLTVFS
jgi:hypothetical protein